MKTRPPHGKRRAIWPSFSLFLWRSLFPSSSSPSPSPPPQITIIAAIGGPTARRGPYVLRCRHRRRRRLQHAAGIMKVATSPACPPRPLTPLYPARPPSRCIVRLLSWRRRRRDLLLAFEMIMPSRPGDTDDGQRQKGRKKEDSHCEKKRRENKLNEGTKKARQAMNMDEIST